MASSKDFRVKHGLVVEQDLQLGGTLKDLSGNPISLGGGSGETLVTDVPLTAYTSIGNPSGVTFVPEVNQQQNGAFNYNTNTWHSPNSGDYNYVSFRMMYPSWSQWEIDAGRGTIPSVLANKQVVLIGKYQSWQTDPLYSVLMSSKVGDDVTLEIKLVNTNNQVDTYTVKTKITYTPFTFPSTVSMGYDNFYDPAYSSYINSYYQYNLFALEWIKWADIGVGSTYGLPPNQSWYYANPNSTSYYYSQNYYGSVGFDSSAKYLNLVELMNQSYGAWDFGYGRTGISKITITQPKKTKIQTSAAQTEAIVRNSNTVYTGTTAPLTKWNLTKTGSTEFTYYNKDVTSSFTTSQSLKTYKGKDFSPILKIGNTLTGIEDQFNNRVVLDGQLSKNVNVSIKANITAASSGNNISATLTGFGTVGATSDSWANNTGFISHNSNSNRIYSDYTTNRSWGHGHDTGILLFKLTDQNYRHLSSSSTVNISYSHSSGYSYVLTCNVEEYGKTNFPFYGSGGTLYYGNTPWVRLRPISGTKNGQQISSFVTDDSNSSTTWNPWWDLMNYPQTTTDVQNFQVSVNYPTMNLTCDDTSLLSVGDTVTINNIPSSVLSKTGNQITVNTKTVLTAANYIGYNIVSGTYDDYATLTKVLDLIPDWIDSVTNSDQMTSGARYVLRQNSNGIPTWDVISLSDVGGWGNSTSTIQVNNSSSPTYTSVKNWSGVNAALYVPYGGIAVKKNIAAGSVETSTLAAYDGITTSSITPALSTDTLTIKKNGINLTGGITQIPNDYKAGDSNISSVRALFNSSSWTNTTITEALGNTFSTNGTVNTSNFVPPGATGKSIHLGNSSSNWIKFDNTSAADVGNQDWTVEAWVHLSDGENYLTGGFYDKLNFLTLGTTSPNSSLYNARWQWTSSAYVYTNQYGYLLNTSGSTWLGGYSIDSSNGTWNHVAFVKNGTTFTMYLNGAVYAQSTNMSWTGNMSSYNFFLVGNNYHSFYYNYRLTLGTARYTGTFIPSLEDYPTTSQANPGTVLADGTKLDSGVKMRNVSAAPSDTFSSGGYLYVEGGALKYKGSNGTITTIGAA